MPGDEEVQGYDEDVFLDGVPQLSSNTSEISTMASTPREHAQYGLRGDRIGETDHLGPAMEAPVRAFFVARDVVLLGDIGVHSLCDGSRVRFPLTTDERWSPGRNDSTHLDFDRPVNRGSGVGGHQLPPVEDSLQPIAEGPRVRRTGMVRRTSLSPDCSRLHVPVVVVVSVCLCASTSTALTLQAACNWARVNLT